MPCAATPRYTGAILTKKQPKVPRTVISIPTRGNMVFALLILAKMILNAGSDCLLVALDKQTHHFTVSPKPNLLLKRMVYGFFYLTNRRGTTQKSVKIMSVAGTVGAKLQTLNLIGELHLVLVSRPLSNLKRLGPSTSMPAKQLLMV